MQRIWAISEYREIISSRRQVVFNPSQANEAYFMSG